MSVDGKGEASGHANAFYESLRANDRQRRLALRQEKERAARILAKQGPEQPPPIVLTAVHQLETGNAITRVGMLAVINKAAVYRHS